MRTPVVQTPGVISGVAWSPDDRYLSYQVHNRVNSGAATEMRVADLESGDTFVVSAPAQDVFPFRAAWLSPGELVYTADGQILRAQLSSGPDAESKLNSAAMATHSNWPFSVEVELERHHYERRARDYLIAESHTDLQDRVSRAYGILCSAQAISSEETMHLLSSVRMGINLGLIDNVEIPTVNQLFIHTQPAHLQKIRGTELSTADRNAERAEYLQRHLRNESDQSENN